MSAIIDINDSNNPSTLTPNIQTITVAPQSSHKLTSSSYTHTRIASVIETPLNKARQPPNVHSFASLHNVNLFNKSTLGLEFGSPRENKEDNNTLKLPPASKKLWKISPNPSSKPTGKACRLNEESTTTMHGPRVQVRITLKEILQDKHKAPYDIESFREFCIKELNEENVDFYLLVNKFHNCQDEEYLQLAGEIFHSYIKEDGKSSVNIPDHIRRDAIHKFLSVQLMQAHLKRMKSLAGTGSFRGVQSNIIDRDLILGAPHHTEILHATDREMLNSAKNRANNFYALNGLSSKLAPDGVKEMTQCGCDDNVNHNENANLVTVRAASVTVKDPDSDSQTREKGITSPEKCSMPVDAAITRSTPTKTRRLVNAARIMVGPVHPSDNNIQGSGKESNSPDSNCESVVTETCNNEAINSGNRAIPGAIDSPYTTNMKAPTSVPPLTSLDNSHILAKERVRRSTLDEREKAEFFIQATNNIDLNQPDFATKLQLNSLPPMSRYNTTTSSHGFYNNDFTLGSFAINPAPANSQNVIARVFKGRSQPNSAREMDQFNEFDNAGAPDHDSPKHRSIMTEKRSGSNYNGNYKDEYSTNLVALLVKAFDRSIFDSAQKEILQVMNQDIYTRFLQMASDKVNLSLSFQHALWWRKKHLTCSEFFSFPTPINDAESRLHNSITWILIVISILLDLFANMPYLYFYVLYGFTVRALTGPRLCPNAFFILYLLRPAVVHIGLLKNKFLPSPPKRFAQCIGWTFTFTGIMLRFLLPYEQRWIAFVVFGALVLAAFVAMCGFCVACWMFGIMVRMRLLPSEVCEECSINYS